MPCRIAIITTKEQCSAEMINYPYQTQEVRDLAWACFSPPLLHIEQVVGATSGITACTLQLTPERRLWLERIDRDPGALLEHLAQRPTHRLGMYFEQLWHFFLQQDPATELIAHNVPVVLQGRTLGEFDCIYYSHQRERHVHLELAVKYFLAVARSATNDTLGYAHEWRGPDNRDRLDTKLDKLLQRQILLGEHPAGKQTLLDLGIDELAKEVALKGYLFQASSAAPPLPPGYNHDCRLSHWVTCSQLPSYCAKMTAQTYLILPKMKWLCAARSCDPGLALGAAQLQARAAQHFEQDTYPLLIAVMDEYGAESARFFVTAEFWPNSVGRRISAVLSSPGT
jgi:uncharacterized protein